MRGFLILAACLVAQQATAACSVGQSGQAYQLGHDLAFQGVSTTAAREVEEGLATCFVIGYREGTLQRLLRTSQPTPPRSRLVRPRNAQRG